MMLLFDFFLCVWEDKVICLEKLSSVEENAEHWELSLEEERTDENILRWRALRSEGSAEVALSPSWIVRSRSEQV